MTPLTPLIATYPLLPFPRHSRIHKLRSFSTPDCACYVKRDDELGFGISGSKLRKYLSLLPPLLEQKPQQAAVLGSSYSNHVVSICQLLREWEIQPALFLIGVPQEKPRGNALWMSLFADREHTHWFPRGSWDKLDSFAQEYQALQAKNGVDVAIIPKGANCREALPGALTLAEDILMHEAQENLVFDHVIVDSGTGMMAASLILAFAWMNKPCKVHVLLIAQPDAEFQEVLQTRAKDWESLFGSPLTNPFFYQTYMPKNAPSFGATNAKVFHTIARLAKQEGFLTDPVYTAKLFHEGERIVSEEQLKGNILFIHSGGGLSLAGFQEELGKFDLSD